MGRQKTHEEFLQQANNLHDYAYSYLEQYVNAKTYMLIRHNICGFEFKQRPSKHLFGQGCPKCGGRHITYEDFLARTIPIHGTNYTYNNNDFINMNTKIGITHRACGEVFYQLPSSHLSGRGCPICNGCFLKTHDEFIKDAESVHGKTFEYLTKYINSKTPMLIRHNVCGYESFQFPNNHLRFDGCGLCGNNLTITNEQFIKESYDLYGDTFTQITPYESAKIPIEFKHILIGCEFKQVRYDYLKGNGCPVCNSIEARLQSRKSNTQFLKECVDIYGNEFEYLDDYNKSSIKINIKHTKCDRVFKHTPNHHLKGNGCPYCKNPLSKKAEKIRQWLINQEFNFILEKGFDECRDKNPLKYDFYLSDYNILIEYDGEQHFKSIEIWGGEEGLKDRQRKDKIKNKFALDNNIPLIRVKYNVKDIDTYLTKHINKYLIL